MSSRIFACGWLGLMLVISACSKPRGFSAEEMNDIYESALADTAAPVATSFAGEQAAEDAALAALRDFFAEMSAASVVADARNVYANDAWLYDNLTVVQGGQAIESYLAHAAEQTRFLRVEFLQVARDGIDYFVRWKMTMQVDALADDAPLVSYGMTQFRFNKDGQVLLHRDFWDSSTGVYEYVPVAGGLIQRLRGRLAGSQSEASKQAEAKL